MMDELSDLYQAVILDHYKHPRNWGRPDGVDRQAVGHNPLCGDRITVYLSLDGQTVRNVRVDGAGCAISVASASMMSEALEGRTLSEARALFDSFHRAVTSDGDVADVSDLGKLAVLAGVRKYPARVKCATLAWHTAHAALDSGDARVTTE